MAFSLANHLAYSLLLLRHSFLRSSHDLQLESEIEKLESIVSDVEIPQTTDNFADRIEEFKLKWKQSKSANDINRTLHLLIEKIIYNRVEDDITLTIHYK